MSGVISYKLIYRPAAARQQGAPHESADTGAPGALVVLRLHIHHIRIPAHRLSIQTRPKPLQIPLLPPHAVPTRHPRVLTQNSGSGNSVCPSESSVVDDPSVTPVPVPATVYAAYDGGSDHTFVGRETPSLGLGPCANAVVERARREVEVEVGRQAPGPRPDAGTSVVLRPGLGLRWGSRRGHRRRRVRCCRWARTTIDARWRGACRRPTS
jgi:hypothetical protein